MWGRIELVKKTYTVFDIIDEVNRDLGEDIVCAYVSEDDSYPVSAMVMDKDLCVSRNLSRQIGTRGELDNEIVVLSSRPGPSKLVAFCFFSNTCTCLEGSI